MPERRVAIVTGAARGIGAGVAERLAQDGFHIVVNDLQQEAAEAAAARIDPSGANAMAYACDVANAEANLSLVDAAVRRYGRLDVMVANAGTVQVRSIDEVDDAHLSRAFGVNVFGAFFGIRAAARQFRAQGGGGKIITCSSIAGRSGSAYMAAYCATKAAVISLTQSAARELAPDRITVNAYCPGAVATDMWDDLARQLRAYGGSEDRGQAEDFAANIPLGRMQTPEDVAAVVSFLAGPDSDYMTGQAVVVDGGILMQ